MSYLSPVTYFRVVLTALGHKEWKDAQPDGDLDLSIPSTQLDRAFHLHLGDAVNVKQNQDLIEFNAPIAIKLYVKGYRDTAEGRDRAVGYFDNILKAALKASTRLTQTTGIKNVTFIGGNVVGIGQNNDNVMKVTMNFNCFINMATA